MYVQCILDTIKVLSDKKYLLQRKYADNEISYGCRQGLEIFLTLMLENTLQNKKNFGYLNFLEGRRGGVGGGGC